MAADRHRRRRLPGTVLTVVGLVLLVVGVGGAALVGASGTYTDAATLHPNGSLIMVTSGVVGTVGPEVSVQARRSDGGPVFVGRGTAADVRAAISGQTRLEVYGVRALHGLRTRTSGTATSGSASSTTNPTTADVWQASTSGTGDREVTWHPDVAGAVLVASPDGSPLGPVRLAVTWHRSGWFAAAVLLIVAGVLGLLAGAHLLTGGILDGVLRQISRIPMPARRAPRPPRAARPVAPPILPGASDDPAEPHDHEEDDS